MSRKTIAKLAGFVGALGISAAMIAAASSATGAYFTDSVQGTLSANNGVIDLESGNAEVTFNNLMPGKDQVATINFNTTSVSNVADVWLVFNPAADSYKRFTGAGTGLGGYGHFKVQGEAGTFESWNLAFNPDGTNAASCTPNVNGHGGQSSNPGPNTQYCGVPTQIKLSSDVSANTGKSAKITFGLTGKATDQGQGNWVQLPFKLVATQPGIAPNA